MESWTSDRIALIRDFQGITVSTYSSIGQLFEFLIGIYFDELQKEHGKEAALQIIHDVVNRQDSLLRQKWNIKRKVDND